MEINGYAASDVGAQRDHNEDFTLADPDVGLYVVCDGVGGHNAGEVASQLAATSVHRHIAGHCDSIERVKSGVHPPDRLGALLRVAIEKACQDVNESAKADGTHHGMACTCTALLIAGGKAVMGHVGDSRLYLCRGGALTQLSEDHTFVAEAIKAGVFSAEEAAACGNRNVITRAVGKERTVLVDTLVFDVVAGDTLLLCSDGLHQYTTDAAELAGLLCERDAAVLPARLISVANHRGGSDNISAIVVRASAPEADAAEARRSDGVLRGLEALRRIDLMRNLSMAELVKFKQIFQDVEFAPGAAIVREGEVNDNLYVIVQGAAEVVRGEHQIAVLPPGAHFGEMSLLNSRPRSATVRAIEPCRMLTATRAGLWGLLQHEGTIAVKFFWELASTLSKRLDEALAAQAELKEQVAGTASTSGYYSGLYQRPR